MTPHARPPHIEWEELCHKRKHGDQKAKRGEAR